ncbi:ABC transporter ATP-binding protein [Desulfobacula sp.]|uniref:ABC transporter ATP-binding protein n=1 Tax=Desulfobacula sp. TaxID=2593537 RepID=UPI002615F99F|nr:ABC transporter ATP-binding protein [Desulfobacula sp.]
MPIRIANLSKYYKKGLKSKKLVIDDLNLEIKKGEVFGFLGPNGAGKSTVIKILLDFIRPDSGVVTIKNLPVNEPGVRKYIGYLPENPFFYDHLTAQETLKFGGKAANMEKGVLEERIDQLLTRLKLSHVKKQAIRTYSKGMVQRLGLALALIHEPEICILDEPMSGLDPLGRRLVADLILDMRKMGKTVFFSSHILSDIESLCDRIGILNEGKLLFCGPLEDFVEESKGLEAAFIKVIETDRKAKE